MTELFFRATSKRALFKLGTVDPLNFIVGLNGNAPTLGAWKYAPGVFVILIDKGKYEIEPSTDVTPAVMDNDHVYANVRLTAEYALADKLPGGDDVWDRSKIALWLKNNGVETDVVSQYPGGPVRRRFIKDLANGDVIELIWPAPDPLHRVWL